MAIAPHDQVNDRADIRAFPLFARTIHQEVYRSFIDYKTTLFLCGSDKQKDDSVRRRLDSALTSYKFSYRYDLFYPEDLFQELLLGPRHHDLLSLENELAGCVDAIVLILESYGAVTELGVFVSNERLRKKLICVVDYQYRKSKSFIAYGPLRLIKDTKQGEIVYGNYSSPENLLTQIRYAIERIRKSNKKSDEILNVVQAHHFALACVYILEPILREDLIALVKNATPIPHDKPEVLVASATSMLLKRGEIISTPVGYKLTDRGMSRFESLGRLGGFRQTYDSNSIDKLRISVLNWKLRNKLIEM